MPNVSLATLYRFCDERGIDRNPQKTPSRNEVREGKRLARKEKMRLFQDLYDSDLSIRENQKLMEEMGLELSIGTIQHWSRSIFNDSPNNMADKVSLDNNKIVYEPINWNTPNSWCPNGISWGFA